MNRDHRAAVRRYWDSVAAEYLARFRDELSGKPFDVSLLGNFGGSLGRGAHVCDVGCGPCAHITRLLADLGLETIGIDLSPYCIELARREQPALDLRVMDALNLSFPESSFDGLVAYYLLHYLPRASWLMLFAEFARVLKPGGRLLLAVKAGTGEGWIPDPMGGTVETFWAACSKNELESCAISAGFLLTEGCIRQAVPNEIAIDRIYLQAERAQEI